MFVNGYNGDRDEDRFEFIPGTSVETIVETFTAPDFIPSNPGRLLLRSFRFANIAGHVLQQLSNNLGLNEKDGWSVLAGEEVGHTHSEITPARFNTTGGHVLFITSISQSSISDVITLLHETRTEDDTLLSRMRVGLPTISHIRQAYETHITDWNFENLDLEVTFSGLKPDDRRKGNLSFNNVIPQTYAPFVHPSMLPAYGPKLTGNFARQQYYTGASALLRNFVDVCDRSFDGNRELEWLIHPDIVLASTDQSRAIPRPDDEPNQ